MFFVKLLFLALDTQSSSKKCCVAFWLPAVFFLPFFSVFPFPIPPLYLHLPSQKSVKVNFRQTIKRFIAALHEVSQNVIHFRLSRVRWTLLKTRGPATISLSIKSFHLAIGIYKYVICPNVWNAPLKWWTRNHWIDSGVPTIMMNLRWKTYIHPPSSGRTSPKTGESFWGSIYLGKL